MTGPSILLLAALCAGEEEVRVGAPAPGFALRDQEGREVALKDFREKKAVLLAFYPRDFTPG
jgi:peroxiredoxin Q/BCP